MTFTASGVNVSGGYWGAGGGLSAYFAKPAYQAVVTTGSTTARTLPDVGMQVGGCPGGISVQPCGPNRSYVITFLQGGRYGLIGTSVSSPEFVGAIALYDQINGGGAGNLNLLYSTPSRLSKTRPPAWHPIIATFRASMGNGPIPTLRVAMIILWAMALRMSDNCLEWSPSILPAIRKPRPIPNRRGHRTGKCESATITAA